MLNLSTTPMEFVGCDACMFEWPGDFAVLVYPHKGEPSYRVMQGYEPVRFIAYADALDYITQLALGGIIRAEKASPAPSTFHYRPVW